MQKIRSIAALITVVLVTCVSFSVGATSTSTSTIVKDGKKITTKAKTDNSGITTTTVTTTDKAGNVTMTTTVTDKDGRIISTDDPDARAKADDVSKEKEARQAALDRAPKRGPSDPIQIALFQTVVSEDLRKATNKDGVFAYLRKEFDNDRVIKPLEQGQVDRYAKDYDFRTGQYKNFSSLNRGPEFLPVDVYVESFAKLEDKVGINRSTKKLASAPFLVYKATITSEYGEALAEVTEDGYILNNVEVTKNFAEKIKAAIRDQIGPTIPKDAIKFRRGTERAALERINASDALRNIFKKK